MENELMKPKAEIELGQPSAGLALLPRNFEGLYRMAQIMAASGLMPKGIQTPEAVFVAVQMGLEVGLSPMQAVQNVAVINGRPSMWGDAVLALIRASGLLDDFDERIEGTGDAMKAVCVAVRKGQSKPILREFSVSDAKAAGLWSKDGPWKQYPKRMLQMRARSWTLRDGFGDVLKGLRVAEEAMDFDMELTQTAPGKYEPPPMEEPEPADDVFGGLAADIAGPELETFLEETASKNKSSVEAVKTQAVEHWDRFAKAYKKWAKSREQKPEPEQKPTAPPVSFSPEYKALMELKEEFREYYETAVYDTGLKPDSVENCVELARLVSVMVDRDNDR